MSKLKIDDLADAIQEELEAYRDNAIEATNEAVKAAGETVVKEIAANAPGSGNYAKSWVSKVTEETTFGLHVTVHSPSRYRIAHLLEHGHAKRNGGRVQAFPHIAQAEAAGEKQLEEDIRKALEG